MNRLDKFYQLTQFEKLTGLPEKIIQKEEELGESIGDNFIFSLKEYNEGKIFFGKLNNWYFFGSPKTNFSIFEDKRTFLLYIRTQFNKANENRTDEQKLDPSWKNFWTREIETL